MEINGTTVFFLILICLILYILTEGYMELEKMQERMRNLEHKVWVTDQFVRDTIVNKVNEKEEKEWQGNIGIK